MLHYFKKVCVLALVTLSWHSVLGQFGEDCSIEYWEEVIGVVQNVSEGVCEYEVDDWSSPNYLELNIEPLIQSSSQIHHFEFFCDVGALDLDSDGRFRPFEIVSENNLRFLTVDLVWSPDRQIGEAAMQIYGECTNTGSGVKPESTTVELGHVKLWENFEGFLIQVSWKPSTNPNLENGWLELYVNGVSAGRVDGNFSAATAWRPRLVRYGSTNTPAKPPLGVFRIFPVNPTPYAFHL